jgi:hypothetical protein
VAGAAAAIADVAGAAAATIAQVAEAATAGDEDTLNSRSAGAATTEVVGGVIEDVQHVIEGIRAVQFQQQQKWREQQQWQCGHLLNSRSASSYTDKLQSLNLNLHLNLNLNLNMNLNVDFNLNLSWAAG